MCQHYFRRVCTISIHALREEGDGLATIVKLLNALFLSTPSARRATFRVSRQSGSKRISIHALREEGDEKQLYKRKNSPEISIHALREEGDALPVRRTAFQLVFLSTPSARRAT